MKKILIILFMLGIANSQAQVLKMKKSGFFSTLRHFLWVEKHVDKEAELAKLTINDLTTKIGGRDFTFRVAHTELDPSRPTVIANMGLNGKIDDANVLFMSKTAQSFMPNVNFVVIDTLSSAYGIEKNCFWTIGGLEGILLLERAIKFLQTETPLKDKKDLRLTLMGGSGSSFTLFHAAEYLNKTNENLVNGIFILSGYDGYHKYLRYTDDIEKIIRAKKKKDVKDIRKKYSLKGRMMGKKLIKTRLKQYNKIYSSCEGLKKVKKLKNFSYMSLLRSSYESIKDDLNTVYKKAYPEKDFEGFTDIISYYEKIKISSHLDELDVPILFVHAKNDPLSLYKEMNTELFSKTKDNLLIETLITDHGGHGAFTWVHGEEWLFNRVENFLYSL